MSTMQLSCAQCQAGWGEVTMDEYLDLLTTFVGIPGYEDYFPESFCPVCRAVLVETPEAINTPSGHELLQDSTIHCQCGHEYSSVVPSTVRGPRVDWVAINQARVRHQADVVKSSK